MRFPIPNVGSFSHKNGLSFDSPYGFIGMFYLFMRVRIATGNSPMWAIRSRLFDQPIPHSLNCRLNTILHVEFFQNVS
jgi:hypothetical protein